MRIELRTQVDGRRSRRRHRLNRQVCQDATQEVFAEKGSRAAAALDQVDRRREIEPGHQFPGPLDFVPHGFERGRLQFGRRRVPAGRNLQSRPRAGFHDERPRHDQRGQLGIAEFTEQPEHVAVDRLLPDILPAVEIAADAGDVDPRIDRGGVQCEQPSFAVTDDADRLRRGRVRLCEPVDRRPNLLHFVANQMAAHLVGGPIEHFPVRRGRMLFAVPGDRQFVTAINQRRHKHAATALGETPRDLVFGRDAGGESDKRFGRLFAVGNDHDAGSKRPAGRLDEQPFAVNAVEGRPANGQNAKSVAASDESRFRQRADEFQIVKRRTRVLQADDPGEMLPVRLDRFLIGRLGRDVAVPERGSAVDRQIEFPQQKPIDAADHVLGQVALNAERPRSRKRFAVGDGSRFALPRADARSRRTPRAKKHYKDLSGDGSMFALPASFHCVLKSSPSINAGRRLWQVANIVGRAASLPVKAIDRNKKGNLAAYPTRSALVAFEGALLAGEL